MSERPAHYETGTPLERKDIIVLLPEFRSPFVSSEEEPLQCMQLLFDHQEDGRLGFCNAVAGVTCACCDRPLCEEHTVMVDSLQEEAEEAGVMVRCDSCCRLSRTDREALWALRQAMNWEEAHP